MKDKKMNKTSLAYLMIIIVVFVWGISPPLNVYINKQYSVALRTAVICAISVLALLIICNKKLKELNAQYLKAIPTGVFLGIASIVQKIGLIYSTPTKYAFLENVSCIVVPVILYFAIKKKPNFLTIVSCVLCVVGVFILSGMNFSAASLSFGIGEVLCALAGVLYGVNIAYTGICIKKLNTLLYLFVQQFASMVISIVSVVLFSAIKLNGAPIETIKFSWDIGGLLLLVALALISNVLCWFLRTYAMKFVNPTAVSIIMPFSAVVTGLISVICGMDVISFEFVVGGLISLAAAILSGVADIKYENKEPKKDNSKVEKSEEINKEQST